MKEVYKRQSEWMTADIWRDGFHYHLEFRKGENVGGLSKEPAGRRKTGSKIRWKPDRAVFTDINVPTAYYLDTIKRQAVVNAGVTFVFTDETAEGGKAETVFYYEKGIENYVEEIAGLDLSLIHISREIALLRGYGEAE